MWIKFGNIQVRRVPPDSAKEEVDATPFNESGFLFVETIVALSQIDLD